MLCDAVEGKLSIISPKIYQDLNENVYNYPESNLLTSIVSMGPRHYSRGNLLWLTVHQFLLL